MDVPKLLSGYDIVAKGVTKLDASLPEIGLKDVIPNGSWLEQKQIQSALEARKHLIEVERIQKFGSLSQAIWHDVLKLAEVTQRAGSHWQYMGHNVGKTLYLRPEETLFLMELNCLLLKHNGVTVSLQKAYSLLLNEINITQYRVYASLSRLGYKILRHKTPKEPDLINQSTNSHENIDVHKIVECNVQQECNSPDKGQFMLNIETNEANVSHLSMENINQSQSINLDTPESMLSITPNIKNGENNPQTSNNAEIQSNIETHSDESKNIGYVHQCEDAKSNTKERNGAHNNESNKNQKIELQNSPLQNIGTKIEDTSYMNICSGDVNIQIVKNEPNIILNKQSNNTMECDQDTLMIESKYDITNISSNTADNLFVVENKNMSENSAENENIRDITVGINNNADIVKSVNVTGEIQKTDSSIQSIETFGENVHKPLAIEVEHTDVIMDLDTSKSRDSTNVNNATAINHVSRTDINISNVLIRRREQTFDNYVTKLKKLTSRQMKQSDYKTIAKYFENVPDLFQKEIVMVNVPDQEQIPRNIFVNNTSYVLNMKEIRNKFVRYDSSQSPVYNTEEVNANHVRRIRNDSRGEFNQNVHFANSGRFPPRQPFYFRPFHFWRPQNNLNYVSFNMYFQQRTPFIPRANPHPYFRTFSHGPNLNINSNNSILIDINRKRMRSARLTHLNTIKNLAVRLKEFIMSGRTQLQHIESLQRLLFAFNNRYKARLRLTEQFNIVNDENIVETIELDEEVESNSKRRKLSQDGDKFDENLNKLRQVALKLKDLEANNKSTPKHKRALSKAIKIFNKSYEADIYMNTDYEVIDKRFVNIASDSESDCVITNSKIPKRKKLKNPFYILKQRSQNREFAENVPSTSRDNVIEKITSGVERADSNKYSQQFLNTFGENWLPNENDFGRAEVIKKNEINSCYIDIINDEYLYRFIENHCEDFNSWLEAKIAYLQHIEEIEALQSPHDEMSAVKEPMGYSGLRPLIDAEDNSDMSSALEKLRIIVNNNKICNENSLSVHFDVYNRDVQNFRKTNPPTPHFRIICMEESSSFPSANEVMALQSKYEDNVAIVFAIVSVGSISYLQINPIDLPVYVAATMVTVAAKINTIKVVKRSCRVDTCCKRVFILFVFMFFDA